MSTTSSNSEKSKNSARSAHSIVIDDGEENPGAVVLKNTVKTLLENGFRYKLTMPAIYREPDRLHSVMYVKKHIAPFTNWIDNFRDDSSIELIFECLNKPHKSLDSKRLPIDTLNKLDPALERQIEELDYRKTYTRHDPRELIITPGSVVAIFSKKYDIIGTAVIDGKIDTRAVVSNKYITVLVQYETDFDKLHQKSYYKKTKYGDYDYREKTNVSAAERFMRSILNEFSGGSVTRKNKPSNRRSRKNN
jgi:hypothetical protein